MATAKTWIIFLSFVASENAIGEQGHRLGTMLRKTFSGMSEEEEEASAGDENAGNLSAKGKQHS